SQTTPLQIKRSSPSPLKTSMCCELEFGEWGVGSGKKDLILHSPFPTPHSPFPTPHSPLPTPHSPLPPPHSPFPFLSSPFFISVVNTQALGWISQNMVRVFVPLFLYTQAYQV